MKNNPITASAPGKLMLMGDHAVVYGYPCIVTAISERLYVSESETNVLPKDTRFVDAAIAAWGENKEIAVSTRSSFSGAYGFGSSSAVTVATLKMLRPEATNKEIFETAYHIVLNIQGKASGFDVAAAVFGGTMYYVAGGKVIEPLQTKALPLIVGYTGVKADTVTLIQQVAQKREDSPQKVDRIFSAIGKLVDDTKVKLLEGDWERVGTFMDFNQEYLRDLGVSSQKIETLIHAAKSAGAYGAKLSGAGGGDCVIAIAPPDKMEAVAHSLQDAGGEVVNVTFGAPGVRLETTDDQNEVFDIVDENDVIIGQKTRYECHHDQTIIHRTIGIVIYDVHGRILLQKRSKTKDMEPGKWGISCAGHVGSKQTYEQAALRELKEELGIETELTFVCKILAKQSQETEMASLYTSRSEGPFVLNSREADDLLFIDPSDLKKRVDSHEIELTESAMYVLKKLEILT